MIEESDDDQDTVKQALLDTNPYLLGMFSLPPLFGICKDAIY